MLPRMLINAIVRAAHILEAQPGYTMPLYRLHAQLLAELGPGTISYSEIYQQLQRRADSFLLIDSPRFLGVTDGWSGIVREQYDSALDGAGLGSCVRVTLTEAPAAGSACDLMTALNATVAELIKGTHVDTSLRAYVDRATLQLNEMTQAMQSAETGRPTTPLRDPPPGAPDSSAARRR